MPQGRVTSSATRRHMTTLVLHTNWSASGAGVAGPALHVWAERGPVVPDDSPALIAGNGPFPHDFAASHDELLRVLGIDPAPLHITPSLLQVNIPSRNGRPAPSPALDLDLIDDLANSDDAVDSTGGTATTAATIAPAPTRLLSFHVPSLAVPAAAVATVLEAAESQAALSADGNGTHEANGHADHPRLRLGASAEFFAVAARFVRWLLVQQRVVPTLVQDLSGSLRGLWQPWLADEFVAARVVKLLAAMPPSARAGADFFKHEPWPILEDFLVRTLDAQCRGVMLLENMIDTIETRRATPDAHVLWLAGLLSGADGVAAIGGQRPNMLKKVRQWVGTLDQRDSGSPWRLMLKLAEPLDLSDVTEFAVPAEKLSWVLSFHLQSVENSAVTLDARDIWVLPTESASVAGLHVEKPQELLLAELARAARLFKALDSALNESEPAELELDTHRAYEFLREVRPILIEQGFGVSSPDWWESPASRLGVRLRIDSPEEAPDWVGAGPGGTSNARVGLETLVNYRWQVTIGDTTLSLEEFERLANLRSPLVLIGGRWVEVRPEDVKAAVEFIRENPGGSMEIGKALRLAYASDVRETGVPVLGMEATGWVAQVFGDANANQSLPILQPPPNFVGSLRPYQVKGLSWLAFLDRFGLGACLADDMGLGKTIQLLAMLLHERLAVAAKAESAHAGATPETPAPAARPLPTLLVVPMSVVGNWLRETHRFAPSLKVLIHHGPTRLLGEPLHTAALDADLVITTYALAHRDRQHIEKIPFARIALDEAQNIKNPIAKQTQAIRGFDAPRRLALTGTPIENRLSELWSIMEFLNPGLLGTGHDFRRKFSVPIEKFHDPHRAKQLRGIVQPFVLRRLKTDPNVIADLPEKLETKEYCYLTPEQAALYESTVKNMLAHAEETDGIQRRGVILAGLVKLKQICNHPHQYLKEHDAKHTAGAPADERRSGKCVRLMQMLDEVVAAGGQALVFSQFRQMGAILHSMLRQQLQREILFLHGGTPAKDRDAMVAAFQRNDGTAPVFILSLKAGGIGLNLTGANHVFHFDRWWNPAVENQATDRAFRIGQTRTVQVHKFVVAGTLEERIDQMIEQKSALADNVIGSGEAWLTELSLSQLKDVLTLRPDAITDDE
ncbi:MAG: DEAD/DEAH box helicase [Phycisphaerales bacterium]